MEGWPAANLVLYVEVGTHVTAGASKDDSMMPPVKATGLLWRVALPFLLGALTTRGSLIDGMLHTHQPTHAPNPRHHKSGATSKDGRHWHGPIAH